MNNWWTFKNFDTTLSVQFVVHLLQTCLYNMSTTNQTNGV